MASNKVGNRRKYPWELWFGQPRTVIRRGIDYQLSQSMMYVSVKTAASRRGVKVKINDTGDSIVIDVLEHKGVLDDIFSPPPAPIAPKPEDSLASEKLPSEEAPPNDSAFDGQGKRLPDRPGSTRDNYDSAYWSKKLGQ